jgi:hypothetical protein
MQLEINGINLPVHPALHTWQDLLQELESKHLGQGKMISSVRFDGNEVLQFREADYLNRPLQHLGEIQVQASPMEDMVKGAVTEAEGYLVTLQTSLVEVAEAFRHQLANEANSKLSQVFEGIKMLAALLQGVELSLSGQYHQGPTSVAQILAEMGPTLESLIESQGQQDWILVADILEFELLANVSGFEQSLAAFKQRLRMV